MHTRLWGTAVTDEARVTFLLHRAAPFNCTQAVQRELKLPGKPTAADFERAYRAYRRCRGIIIRAMDLGSVFEQAVRLCLSDYQANGRHITFANNLLRQAREYSWLEEALHKAMYRYAYAKTSQFEKMLRRLIRIKDKPKQTRPLTRIRPIVRPRVRESTSLRA